jgi:hypothetical protein
MSYKLRTSNFTLQRSDASSAFVRPPSLAVARLNVSVSLASASLDLRVGNSLGCSTSTLNPKPSNGAADFVPIANQPGFHATTAGQARRPCSRIYSYLPFGLTSGQEVRLTPGNSDPSACRCGGDRCDLFVRDNHVATCLARVSCGIALRKQ